MESIEERVQFLENRVLQLENRLGVYHEPPQQFVRPPVIQYQNNQKSFQTESAQPKKKWGEAVVGKYIVGALASLLVFVAAVSLIALVWDDMSAQAKLSLLVGIGLLLTITGFMRVKKHKDPITSIIIGTGSGLLFIDILAANMAFDLISSNLAFLAAGCWSVFFILSYRYTQTFFTTIIAYLGSFVALLLGLSLVNSEMDYIVVLVFTVSIVLAMLVSGYKWFDHSKQMVCTIFGATSVGCLLLFGTIDNQVFKTDWLYFVVILVVVLQALVNRIFYLFERLKVKGWSLVIGGVAAMLTLIAFIELDFIWCAAIFIFLLLIQILILERQDYVSSVSLTKLYSCFIMWQVLILAVDLFEYPIGISVVAVLLLLLDRRKKTARYDPFAGGIVLVDTILLLASGSVLESRILLVYIFALLINVGVISYILYKRYQSKKTEYIIELKMIGFFAFMSDLFFLVLSVYSGFIETEAFMNRSVPAFLCVTILLVGFYISGFFGDWINSNFKWFAKDQQVTLDNSVFAFYMMTTLMYVFGLSGLSRLVTWYEQFLVVLCVFGIALIQSANLLQSKVQKELIGVWLGLKYCIITWVVLNVSFGQSLDSLVFSMSGLILALLCILIGFQIKTKSLRLYGLILTIAMVIKFIVVDLSQENSIIRVLALLLGGGICFGISVFYNKLNDIVSEKK